MSQEDVERLDEDEAAVEEQDEDDSPDAEGHTLHRGVAPPTRIPARTRRTRRTRRTSRH